MFFYILLILHIVIIVPMTTRQAQNTKETLKKNVKNFENLKETMQNIQDDYNKAMMIEIEGMRKKRKQLQEKQQERTLLRNVKGKVLSNYTEDRRYEDKVPVDGQIKQGTMIFMTQCATCHSLDAIDPRPKKGPSLGIVYNRSAGSNLSFPAYSDSMLKSKFFWNPLNLYEYMADPNKLVKGTTCGLVLKPIKSQEQRADLIALFRQYTRQMKFFMKMKEIQRLGYTQYQSDLFATKQEMKRGQLIAQQQKKYDKKN